MNTNNANKLTECITLFGEKVKISTEKLKFRIAGYALIVHDGKILLTTGKNTGKYWFPGGATELGEKLEDAVLREVIEETGVDVSITKYLTSDEIFFYYEPLDMAFHQYSVFFLCSPLSLEIGPEDQLDKEEENEKPEWVEIKSLKKEDFQPGSEKAFDEINKLK